MSLTPQAFVNKWKPVTAGEKQAYQQHFLDLCKLVDHPAPAEIDPAGKTFAFEMGANKSSGGQGWADVVKLGYFAWEYKGQQGNLDKAYQQLSRYRDALQNPPLLIVSDFHTIIIRTSFTNYPQRTITLTLDDLLTADGMKTLRAVFTNPEGLKPERTSDSVTQEAASQFSRLAHNLSQYGDPPQQVAHFLIRLLFCLFAEDIGLLPARLIPRMLDASRRNGAVFAQALRELFAKMKDGGLFGMEAIPHFNGGLFDDDQVLTMDSESLAIIAEIDSLDWSAIEPSIFGTLFERGLDPGKRSQLGAHYTSKDDILLIVEPVLMQPLRREWAQVRADARKIMAWADGKTEKQRTAAAGKAGERLRQFSDKIASTRVLDPACGSGNFLYVALQLLLDLQEEVIRYTAEIGAPVFLPTVTPQQLYGIEINEYAHELAQVTIWIGYLQWMIQRGYGYSEPVLKQIDNIRRMDAILAYDEHGQAVEPQWPAAEIIVGNPPFLGDKKMRSELGDAYVEALRKLYSGRLPGQSDLVCYWFEKARALIETGIVQRAGLLATQAIRHGQNRYVLDQIVSKFHIIFAISNQKWFLDGASVRVSMVGFDKEGKEQKYLDGHTVAKINSDLTASINLTTSKVLPENKNIAFIGTQKGGSFDISFDKAAYFLSISGNPNNRPNSDVVRPWLNGSDITGTPKNKWIIFFGIDTSVDQASMYEKPFEYVLKNVKAKREDVNSEERTTTKWWLHQRPRPEMWTSLTPLSRFIASPRVAKYRLFVWVNKDTIPDSRLLVIAREDEYFFGVLHSIIHEQWSLATSPRHGVGNDPTYNAESCFETFPFPWPPGQEPQEDARLQAVAVAAKELVELRDNWLNAPNLTPSEQKQRTLTNLYNQRPTWLDLAHKRLDKAVFAAYGWPDTLTDEQILEHLLALNHQRAGKGM